MVSASAWLTRRRIRAHVTILALCLWGVCALDFATPGLFDRQGNVKFQDFLPVYVSARMIHEHRAGEIYNATIFSDEVQAIVHRPTIRVPNLYGPQVGVLFAPMACLSFPVAAGLWSALSSLIYFICAYAIWRSCPSLSAHRGLVVLVAVAYPPFFHFFVRGQLSALVLLCFTVAWWAMRTTRPLLAGCALGFLVFKPQFLVAIPLILLLARTWKLFGGTVVSAMAQLVLARLYSGSTVMANYISMLAHPSAWISTVELNLAPVQMHSLRSFWELLLPWPTAATVLYVVCALAVIAIAAGLWKSAAPITIRFSALLLAAVLCNPHLFIYDLLALAPAFLLLVDWSLNNLPHPAKPALAVLLYLAFLLPLFGPLAGWTHLQLSVIAFAALLWTLRGVSIQRATAQS